MIIDGLSSDEIKIKLKDFCRKVIELADKKNRSSEDVYEAVLLSSDWINALSKLWKKSHDQNVYNVALQVEKIHEHTECIARRLENSLYDQAEQFAVLAKEEAQKLIVILDS